MQLEHKPSLIVDGHTLTVGIVTARFNEEITHALHTHAIDRLHECNVEEKNIRSVTVAGAAEIPIALQKLARTKKYDCLIALGCVIRGETPHFEYVCTMVQQGILRVSLDEGIPIGFGIITVHTLEQALARKNLGADAASAALECALI